MNANICKMCSESIIKLLDEGVVPWRKPWVVTGGAKSHTTGKPYSLLNQLMLGGICGEFVTFNQVKKEGGKVKKGAKSFPIVFWKILDGGVRVVVKGNNLAVEERDYVPYLQYYRVFALSDCEGIEPKYENEPLPNVVKPEEIAEEVWRSYCERESIPVHNDYVRPAAYYDLTNDEITLPKIDQFFKQAEYYSTVFHEVVHSTGHKKRLDRPFGVKGTKKYAQEELTAEIGACALLAHLGLSTGDSLANNASYIKFWRDKIAEDNSLIVVAAGRAQKAVERILNIKSETTETKVESD